MGLPASCARAVLRANWLLARASSPRRVAAAEGFAESGVLERPRRRSRWAGPGQSGFAPPHQRHGVVVGFALVRLGVEFTPSGADAQRLSCQPVVERLADVALALRSARSRCNCSSLCTERATSAYSSSVPCSAPAGCCRLYTCSAAARVGVLQLGAARLRGDRRSARCGPGRGWPCRASSSSNRPARAHPAASASVSSDNPRKVGGTAVHGASAVLVRRGGSWPRRPRCCPGQPQALFAEAHGFDLLLAHAQQRSDQFTHRLGALLAQGQVVFAAAAFVGVAFHHQCGAACRPPACVRCLRARRGTRPFTAKLSKSK